MGKPRVFLSYSRRDADWARSFAEALKQRGVSVWFDEFDVKPGEPLREALESALRNSDVLVALLDPEYPSTPAVFFELGAALGMGKEVVSIVPKDHLPLNVRLRRYLVRDSPEETAEELSHTLLAA